MNLISIYVIQYNIPWGSVRFRNREFIPYNSIFYYLNQILRPTNKLKYVNLYKF